MKKVTNFITLLVVLLAVIFVAGSYLLHLHLYTVDSGSMEPNIKTNSVVFVMSSRGTNYLSPFMQPLYNPDEIITFKKGKEIITHRVNNIKIDNKRLFYQTKGDANKGEDVELISEDNIIGRVVFSAPFLGKINSFARTQLGLILLVIIPSTIIVYDEIHKIRKEICSIFKKRESINESFSS